MGGNWNAQNKVIPSVYQNWRSEPVINAQIGQRGRVLIAKELDWGALGEVINLRSPNDALNLLGHSYVDIDWLVQMYLGTDRTPAANLIKVFRLGSGGSAASGTIGELTVTGRYVGSRGNDVSITIQPDIDTAYTGEDGTTTLYAVFVVDTIVDGLIRDSQTVGSFTNDTTYEPAVIGDLNDNAWVIFTGNEASLIEATATSGLPLTGGEDVTVTNASYSDFLSKVELEEFDVVIYDGTDTTLKTAYRTFINDRIANEGYYSQLVTSNFSTVNDPYVVSVVSGYESNNVTYTPEMATWWVGSCMAGCPLDRDLTYAKYPLDATPTNTYTTLDLEDELKRGSFILVDADSTTVRILDDQSTHVTYTPTTNQAWNRNDTIRFICQASNDWRINITEQFIGNFRTDDTGRGLVKQYLVGYLSNAQGQSIITDFSEDDVTVELGEQVGGIVCYVSINKNGFIRLIYIDGVVR